MTTSTRRPPAAVLLPARVRAIALLTFASLLLVLSGCDTTGGGETEIIVLPLVEVDFRYAVEPNRADDANSLTVEAEETLDLNAFLEGGFTRDDIVTVSITSVNVEVVNASDPNRRNLNDFLNRITVRLENTSTEAEASVASLGAIPGTRDAQLEVTQANVTDLVTGRGFTSALEMAISDNRFADYIVSATLELRIEVQDI